MGLIMTIQKQHIQSFLFGFLLATLLVFVLAISSHAKDKTIDVRDNDQEMNAAIEKARATLSTFWQKYENPKPNEKNFALKVAIKQGPNIEHFWLVNIERNNQKVYGIISNDPNYVTRVRKGQRIEIPQKDISDWMFIRNGKYIGSYTTRVLIKRMPPNQAAYYKKLID